MSSKPKIIHLSSAHLDRDDRIFYKQCVSLAEKGFDVHLVLVNVEERMEKNVHVHSVNMPNPSRIKRVWTAVNAVYKKGLELDGDLYHLHDPELLRIAKKLKRKGKKVVYDAHEDLPRQILGKEYLRFRKTISRFAERFENRVASKIDGVIAATPFIRDRYLKLNKNSIDINNYPMLSEFYTEKTERLPNKNCCYVGGITRYRGIIELIKSLSYTDAKLVLAGSFDPQDLETEAKQLSNWSKVDYRGFLNRSEVKNVYNEVSVGMVTLHPLVNYLDSLPVKMFEYMLSGLPVICSNFPYWESIVVANGCGISVDPMNVEATGKAIQFMIDNPEKAAAMGEKGRKLVLEKYNWNIELDKLVGFYHLILQTKPFDV